MTGRRIAVCAAVGWAGVVVWTAVLPRVWAVGYDNTPMLPDSKYRVHDGTRPQPPVVTPGTASTQEAPGRPPSDAIVLFDGKDLSQWVGRKGPAAWTVKDGTMEVNKTGGIKTKESFGDCQLHVEWASPTPPKGSDQGRGNSGVFLMGRYEVQVLDGYDNVTYADGGAGGVYGQWPPLVNACRKPGTWQSYDIIFRAPRFADGKLVEPAYITVLHNGVVVQDHAEILGATAWKRVAKYTPHGEQAPISLQAHGAAVRYRNIWIRRLKGYDTPADEKKASK